MPKLEKIIETALYCDDLQRSIIFYQDVLELTPMVRDERFCAFDVNHQSVFLLFQRGGSLEPVKIDGGVIPPHNGHGPIHMAFAISKQDLSYWENRLNDHEVIIISRFSWPSGGTSLYFHDPDQHLIELVTPGVWKIY